MWTLKLFEVSQMPIDFREPFIISRYRSTGSTFICCLKSMFQKTNETLNFWTHFVPLLYFMWKLFSMSRVLDFWNDPHTWPFAVYMVSVCAYLSGSSFAHLFNCLSEHARHVCFFIDYAAISMYSIGAAMAYRYYAFPETMVGGVFYHVYLTIATFNGIICTMIACSSRIGDRERVKELLRLISFALPYIFDSIPLLIRLTNFYSRDTWLESNTSHAWQFVCMISAAYAFATHVPECLLPGMFDLFGNSHQILHVASAMASYQQLKAITWDMVNRREYLETYGEAPTPFWSFGTFVLVLCANIMTVYVFGVIIRHEGSIKKYTGRLFYSKNTSPKNESNNVNLKQS